MQTQQATSLPYPFNQFAANPRSLPSLAYADEALRLSRLVDRRIRQFDAIRKLVDLRIEALCDKEEWVEAKWLSHRFCSAHSKAFNRIDVMQSKMLTTVRQSGN